MTAKDVGAKTNFTFGSSLSHDIWDFSDLILKWRFTKAIEEETSQYSIYRDLRFAARIELETLFDDLALNLGFRVQRLNAGTMILDSESVFISAHGAWTGKYCSCSFGIWATSPERAEDARTAILDRVGNKRITEPMFSIDWHFLTSRGELESASIEELADDILQDAAYPDITQGISDFIKSYLDAEESVLVLQGPPGTGKTRFIRAILAGISRRKGGKAYALYTGDRKALESDEVFVRFITGREDAFVVEDADHLLKPRADGNENLHRFLAIADGVVRAQGRKIIFSTNLPNVGDLDDALIRPGRCFARLSLRGLSIDEAENLLHELCEGKTSKIQQAREALLTIDRKLHSLAEIYKAVATIEQDQI